MAGPGGSEVGRVAIRVVPATDTFTKDLTAYLRRVEKELRVDIPTSLDLTGFKEDLRRLEVESKLAHPTVKVDVDLDKSTAREIENIAGKLGILRKAADVAGAGFDGVAEASGGLLSGLGRIPPVAVGIAAALATAVPLAADLVVSLGPGLLTAIPAILGAGAAIAVAGVSIDRLQSAFKPVIHGFEDMQDAISKMLTRGVRPLAKEFAEQALPTIERGLLGVARVMNGFLKDFLSWAASASTVRLIGQVFDGLAASMKPLGGAATAFADAILRIAKDAAPGLKIVSDAIRNLAVRFDNFIKSKDKDGSLTKTISDSVVATGRLIVALSRLVVSVGGLFASIGKGSTSSFTDAINGIATAVDRFNAGGGGAKIRDFLIGVGKAIGDYFSSGEFQRTVSDFRTFATNVSAVIGPMRDLVGGIQGLVAGLRSQPAGGTVLDSLTAATNPLVNTLQVVNNLKTAVPQAWAAITAATSAAWAAISGFVSTAWATITSTTTSATGSATATIRGAWSAVVGFFAGVWASITSAVSTGWAAVVAAVSTAAGAVAAAFRTVVAVISAVWSAFWNNSFVQLVVAGFGLVQAVINLASAAVEAVFRGLLAFITLSVQGIVGAVTRAWNLVYSTTVTAWGAVSSFLSTVWATISGVVSRAATAVTGYVTTAWNAVSGVTSRVWSAVSGAVSAAWAAITARTSSAGAGVFATVSSWFSRVWTTIVNAFQQAYTGASQWISNLVTAVSGLGGRILAAVSGFGSMLFDAGARLIQGLIDGITSKINAVTGAINGIASKIRGFFPGSPVKEGPLVSWNNGGAGKRLVAMLVTGLSDTSDVESAMRSLAGKVAVPLQASTLAGTLGGTTAGSVATGNTFNIYYPEPEKPSDTITRTQRRMALLGLA